MWCVCPFCNCIVFLLWCTGTPQRVQDMGITRTSGLCSFPNSSWDAICSFGAVKPWANMFIEKAVVMPGLLFWGVRGSLKLTTVPLNLGLLFPVYVDVVFIDTKFRLMSCCPVALYHSPELRFCTVITHFYSFSGFVSSINLIGLLSVAFSEWLVDMLNDTEAEQISTGP